MRFRTLHSVLKSSKTSIVHTKNNYMTETDRKKAQRWTVVLIFLGFLIIDQAVKIWVKTHMTLHESIVVTDWFRITFIENNGMAFGWAFITKTLLTILRLAATLAVGWYILRAIGRGVHWGYLICLAFIMTGAAGNIVDCVFYGEIFSASTPFQTSHFVPVGEGYSSWLNGQVVDMFYFPLCHWTWPDWLPFVGGRPYTFFSYIFNVADACISSGVIALLLFFRQTLSREFPMEK